MNVAFVNRMLGITRGGGEIWDLRMAEELRDLGVEVTFYVGKPMRSELEEPIDGFETVEVSTPHLNEIAYAAPIGIGGALYDLDGWFFRRRVVKKLEKRDHDIIDVNSDPQFGGYVDRLDQPVTVKMHGPPHSLWQDYLNPLANSYDFFEKFDAVIATGVTTERIEARTDVNVYTINPGVNTDQFTLGTKEADGKTILFVGRFVPAKDIPTLLNVFERVQNTHPDASLILIGDGPHRNRVESKVDELDLEDAVSLPGYVDNEDLPEYYREASVFALSSQRDNHPITLLEAMSSGTPVVAPGIGWIPEIIEHDQDGLVYDTIDEMVEYLDRLLASPSLREEFGKKGRTKAVGEFSWNERAEDLYSIYNQLL